MRGLNGLHSWQKTGSKSGDTVPIVITFHRMIPQHKYYLWKHNCSVMYLDYCLPDPFNFIGSVSHLDPWLPDIFDFIGSVSHLDPWLPDPFHFIEPVSYLVPWLPDPFHFIGSVSHMDQDKLKRNTDLENLYHNKKK